MPESRETWRNIYKKKFVIRAPYLSRCNEDIQNRIITANKDAHWPYGLPISFSMHEDFFEGMIQVSGFVRYFAMLLTCFNTLISYCRIYARLSKRLHFLDDYTEV